ncbi:MAG: hypothetical protein LBM96_11810 [Methanobrevibacter sp.]|jgi:hypothetical protein|nr:hypothetical protein [Candidatus Methanoflexus mossambicus]
MKSKINSIYRFKDGKRVYQGDFFSDLELVVYNIDNDELIFDQLLLPYSVVLSQDCDLESDFKKREEIHYCSDEDSKKRCYNKFLDSILLCPAFLAERLREGNHLNELGRTVERINKKDWKKIQNNDNHRYHFIPSENIDKYLSMPDLVIDFKKYYTIPRDYLYFYNNKYKSSLNELVREDLSNRFAYFQSRIGLPNFQNNKI